ncbi:mRNA-capping enzyme-like [Paramacrobiotus metropolitanus]|uniref:mRNA-capping enzyme-like n=1 Tax=Paramacrobiotus metropolitanus TaxID=2943436 RepID=UPI0024460049|nr:mRNA-capping enzyme-like [Paramacrobiotus metropolitanus]
MASRDRRLDAVNKPKSERFWEEVPPRWMNCPPVGQVVADLFLPFKTPLNSTYDAKIPDVAKRFGVEDVFDSVEQQGRSIDLWINLAKTERFYDPKSEITDDHAPAKYIQCSCAGHAECPTEEQTHLFIEFCKKYHNDRSDSLIAVHCTHGFNRTGFLICAYLVEVCDYSVEDAIEKFAQARPPGIYKEDYLQTLCRRYHADPDDLPPVPDLPSWCFEEESEQVDDDGNTVDTATDPDGPSNGSVQRRPKNVPQFMEGVPGVVYLQDVNRSKAVQQKCKRFCGWNGPNFPGCQPVSMDLSNKQMIADQPYRVSWKADGVRYMLLIEGENDVYFLDRNNDVFQVEGMNFPYVKGDEPYMGAHVFDTLLDGEMILDRVGPDEMRARFLVYDIVHWMNEDTRIMNFDTRCQRIKNGVMEPRDRLTLKGLFNKALEPFSIRQKDFYPVKTKDQNGFVNMAAKFLGEKFRKLLTHDVDGLIFQPYDMPYTPGRCDRVLKWKPPSQCTIDFRVRVEKSERRGEIAKTSGKLYVGGLDHPFGELKWSKEYTQLNGKIIECRYDYGSRKWIFERIRTDKNTPNHYTTANAVFKGIERPLTQEILMNFIVESVPYFEEEVQRRRKAGSTKAQTEMRQHEGRKHRMDSVEDEAGTAKRIRN